MKQLFLLLTFAIFSLQLSAQEGRVEGMFPTYLCLRASSPITLDGDIYGKEWESAPWSDEFVDIRGIDHPLKPKYQTRMKMLWDDTYLYVAAELLEPHIWANITERDATIYYDNDFEIFIDPNGTGHNYFEFEMNAFGTEWDLLMTKPYKFQGNYINGYDMNGLITKVKIYGTINDPSDIDEKWCVELAIPLKSFKNGKVVSGEQWRMNFSRVEWLAVDVVDGKYVKQEGKKSFGNEENWVWAPTGIVDIHKPEYWGFVQFSEATDSSDDKFVWNDDEDVRFELHRIMDLQRKYYTDNGRYAKDLNELDYSYASKYKPEFYPAREYIVISATSDITGNVWSLGRDGRLWQSK